jgi:hypothetical protein
MIFARVPLITTLTDISFITIVPEAMTTLFPILTPWFIMEGACDFSSGIVRRVEHLCETRIFGL